MVLLRRFLVLTALAFWQGGFAFYAVVVVPVGQQVLGSHIQQGFVTRRVTNYLNVAGFAASVVMLWDIVATRRASTSGTNSRAQSSRTAHRVRTLAWFGMFLTLLFQVWLHPRLEQLLDIQYLEVLDEARFYAEHRWYLLASAGQWLCCLTYLAAAISLWRTTDTDRVARSV